MPPTMTRNANKYGWDEYIIQEHDDRSFTSECNLRADDTGLRSVCKAWYLFLIHLIVSGLIMVGVIMIDGLPFQIGAGPTIFTVQSRLYQVQATGLLSLGLVVLRLIAGCCSSLLAWRIIYILLEKRGISVVELTHLISWRIPVLPGVKPKTSILWSLWAAIAIVLLWPQAFAAPLATSSLSWIPGTIVSKESMRTSVTNIGDNADWASILYEDMRVVTVVTSAAMTAKQPVYAFNSSSLPLRRYFNSSDPLTDGSKIDLKVPYIAIDLRWVDATSDHRSQNAGSPQYTDVNDEFGIRNIGTIAIIRDEPWDAQAAMPSEPSLVVGKKLVNIKLETLNFGDKLPDGTLANNDTKCLTVSDNFGKLPDVNQHQSPITNGEDIVAYDCYIFAEATITAGVYSANACDVTSSAGVQEDYATCFITRDDSAMGKDWLAALAVDFMSETLKYTVMQNYSQPWISNNIDEYTAGMLMLGYHATWSGLMKRLGTATEQATVQPVESIVFASIDTGKLYIWLGMNLTLTLSAVLVAIGQSRSRTKTIRDTTVAALTMDLTEVAHDSRASRGLCNAVDLNKQDGKLPRWKWKQGGATGSCIRRVAFVDDIDFSTTHSYEIA